MFNLTVSVLLAFIHSKKIKGVIKQRSKMVLIFTQMRGYSTVQKLETNSSLKYFIFFYIFLKCRTWNQKNGVVTISPRLTP